LGTAALLLGRWLLRRDLVHQRQEGRSIRRVVLLGGPSAVQHLNRSLKEVPGAGYVPVAAVLPGFSLNTPAGEEGLPLPVASVSGDIRDILNVLEDYQADALAISAGVAMKTRTIRQLGWELADRRISQIMAPALTDIAGPRIHAQPVAGLSLIHVSTPRLAGPEAFLKRTFDILASTALLLLLSPVFLVVALGVRIDDPGPAFFHQRRVGKGGQAFHMHKFRSMVVDAETRLAKLQAKNQGAGVLFKMKDDPRITKLGAFIRRYSIDELPQLWNVLVGEMSLVGPRPPLPAEVEEYEAHVSRRLLVKPGITGLWQVSGRSDLSWDESVRLDLYYVEDWNFFQDLLILGRTAKAVVGKDGAY
jgi:exopolysaccharide biosynthesis polyprenyl glycosylphosphotransferase